MTATATPPAPAPQAGDRTGSREHRLARSLRALLTQRIVLLAVLIVVVVVWFFVLDAGGYLTASTTSTTCRPSLINAVPLAMLGLAELLVILSGRGGIDLSVGAIVSLAGMVFGFAYGEWGWPLLLAILLTAAFGALCGRAQRLPRRLRRVPGADRDARDVLRLQVAGHRHQQPEPDQHPADPEPVLDHALGRAAGVRRSTCRTSRWACSSSCCPTVVVVWLLLARTTYGRRLYAVGTNDVAGRWAGIPVRGTRFKAYVYAGLISGLVAVVTVAQFASARPDAGVSGNGMALPAITIAVLGGVAITGGIGRVAGVVLATLLIVWLNAGILLAFVGNEGSQYQLLALGAVLIFAALLNGLATRRYGGSR